jgi:hypothetical protein
MVQQDINAVVNNLNNIIQELVDFDDGKINTLSPQLIAASLDFLGIDFSQTSDAKELATKLYKIRDGLSSLTRNNFRHDDFNYNPKKMNTFTHAPKFGKRIYLGDKYFNSLNTGNDTRQGILIHEETHKSKVLSTKDLAYGVMNSKYLQVDDKPKNADNWEYFYERLKTGGK